MEPGILGQTLAPQTFLAGDPPAPLHSEDETLREEA